MRNDRPGTRGAKGGVNLRAYVAPINLRKARYDLDPAALVMLEIGTAGYRRLTPEHAERLARELLAAATEARGQRNGAAA